MTREPLPTLRAAQGFEYEQTSRVLEGLAAPYGITSGENDSGRAVVFQEGAFDHWLEQWKQGSRRLWARWNHERKLTVGIVRDLWDDDRGLHARIDLATDVLSSTIYDGLLYGKELGLSVASWAEDYIDVGDRRFVRRARLKEISVVREPAFEEAQIKSIDGWRPGECVGYLRSEAVMRKRRLERQRLPA